METRYQECSCSSVDHTMRLTWFSEDFDVIYVTTHLTPLGFWRRVWHAIKYILGRRSKYGDFEEYMWFPEDVDGLIESLEEFKNGNEERNELKGTSVEGKSQ